ncbi:MAG TPA: ATP synthase F1 subunit delta [Bacteroides sp.]|nr:ATP synthase F1 subunit delta [Bacteroides sp.]
MSTGMIAVRYAKALFLSAREQKALDSVRADMELILEAATGISDIQILLESPILDSGKKTTALVEIFKSRISTLSLDFIRMVTGNKREEYLPGMARYYIQLYKEEKGIQVATISSAVKLDTGSRDQIKQMISAAFKSEIELKEEVKEDLLGGFIIKVENKQLDASVKGKLACIKKELQE